MTVDNSWSAYIFREGKVALSGRKLVEELADGLGALHGTTHAARWEKLVDVLLRAGELECALRDAESPYARVAEGVTESIAAALVSGSVLRSDELARVVRGIVAPQQVKVAPPEGFAYYALHPLDVADLVRRCAPCDGYAAVVGIRSIGTTLSALVKATLHDLEVRVERTTVRPFGHPYNRRTEFSQEQHRWIAKLLSHRACFFVVDEGPGMSGSSFLSVGDALLSAGVPRSQIAFLCTRRADPASLMANNAADRWPAFNAHYTDPTKHLPTDAKEYIAGGIWRAKAFASEEQWPASWIQMERLKFLSTDGTRMFRFEGFGRFGADLRERSAKVGDAGFGPTPERSEQGFGIYPMLRGRYLSSEDADEVLLKRIAGYCAFRARELARDNHQTSELETMLRFNTQQEFGVELPASLQQLPVERPVVADARMLPHKWMVAETPVKPTGGLNGAPMIMKLDAATHGDDHFFPGPTDIAWDLAGTILEWRLPAEAATYFVACYRARSGDDPSRRLPAYLMAYSIFRTAYCKMAGAAMRGAAEYPRMMRHYQWYRSQAARVLGNLVPQQESSSLETRRAA